MLDINNKEINPISTKGVTDINFTNMPDHVTISTISLDLTTGTITGSDNNLNLNSLPLTFGNSTPDNLYNNLDTINFSGSDIKIIYASTAKTLTIPDGETLTISEGELSSTAIDIVLGKNAKVNLPNEFTFINSYHDKMTLNDIATLLKRTTSYCTEHAKILSNTDNSTLETIKEIADKFKEMIGKIRNKEMLNLFVGQNSHLFYSFDFPKELLKKGYTSFLDFKLVEKSLKESPIFDILSPELKYHIASCLEESIEEVNVTGKGSTLNYSADYTLTIQ